jgi:hypothetical protein
MVVGILLLINEFGESAALPQTVQETLHLEPFLAGETA